MDILRGLLGLGFIIGLGLLLSTDRRQICWRQVGWMIILQIVITFVCLRTNGGIIVLTAISNFFVWLMAQAAEGTNFVFGGIRLEGFVFFFNALLPIVFISALLGILNYIGLLQMVIRWTGRLLHKVTRMGEMESYFAVSTSVLGQPEVYMTILDQLPSIPPRQLYTLCASGMSAVSAALLASYMTMVDGKYVVVAVFLNILSSLTISRIVNPYDPVEENAALQQGCAGLETKLQARGPFFEMLGTYIFDGFRLAVTIAAMLIGFIALIALLNNSFSAVLGVSFTQVTGYIFSPMAWLLGVPGEEVFTVGGIMATKLITNEFAAMIELGKLDTALTEKSMAMLSTYLISFANFGSLGIVSGGIKALNEKQGTLAAAYSMRLLAGATMASMWTAAVVGIFF